MRRFSNGAVLALLTFFLTLFGTLLPSSSVHAGGKLGPFELPDDHFLCYKGKTARGDLAIPSNLTVTLSDDFGSDRLYSVGRPGGICNPADKNGEGIVDDVTHLTSYRIRVDKSEEKHQRQSGIRVLNQFGEIVVATSREDRILVPATKDAAGGPVNAPDPTSHEVDHYKCYRTRVLNQSPAFTKPTVTVEDQFETPAKLMDIKKPTLLCNAVDKNGEGINKPDGHLMCYKAKPASGSTEHEPRLGISTADQFVIHKMDTKKEELLCVPSLTNPPAEFCGDGVVNQTPFEDCDGDATPCAVGQICTAQCNCVAPVLGERTFSLSAGSKFQSSFTGGASLGTPEGTLTFDGGTIDINDDAPVTLTGGPSYMTVRINIGAPQATCYEFLSCAGTIHCAGGANVDVLESLSSLPSSEGSCIQDGSASCPADPSSVCCSNSCEGASVGSGNLATVALGVGAGDSGPGALALTCDVRILVGLPIDSDCAVQDYSAVPIVARGFTTGTATSQVTEHCAGTGAAPDVVPTFAASGVNFECSSWTTEDGPGTLVWALPAEEPTVFIGGDGANALSLQD